MMTAKQTYDQIYARGYWAGIRVGKAIETDFRKKYDRMNRVLFWTTWGVLCLSTIVSGIACRDAGRAQEVLAQREYQVKEFLYTQYRAGSQDITDQMNALGYEEDILSLEFQKVEKLIDSGTAPDVAKASVFR